MQCNHGGVRAQGDIPEVVLWSCISAVSLGLGSGDQLDHGTHARNAAALPAVAVILVTAARA